MKSTCLVLAGGEGSRFTPLNQDKVTFPFFGKPLWQYSVAEVLPSSIDKLYIVANHTNEVAFRDWSSPIPKEVRVQTNGAGMAEAVLTFEDKLSNEGLLVLIADDVFDTTLPEQVLSLAKSTGAFGILPGWRVSKYFPGGYLVSNEQGRITSIIEKPKRGSEPSDRVVISGQYFSNGQRLVEIINKISTQSDDRYEQAVQQLLQEEDVRMLAYDGQFASLKYPWHVLSVMSVLFARLSSFASTSPTVKNNVTIEGLVVCESGVRIYEGAKIVGPCYIGKDTIIGNNAIIRESYIGPGCVVGYGSDITRSYIGAGCWFHSNYIGDSVLERNVSMGAGTILANLRLDEAEIHASHALGKIPSACTKLGAIIGANVRIGVNTSTMPGICIGGDSAVGAGIVIAQHIPSKSFVTGKTELLITPNSRPIPDPESREGFKKAV